MPVRVAHRTKVPAGIAAATPPHHAGTQAGPHPVGRWPLARSCVPGVASARAGDMKTGRMRLPESVLATLRAPIPPARHGVFRCEGYRNAPLGDPGLTGHGQAAPPFP